MEPVAKLSVNVALSSDYKGETLSASTRSTEPQEGFSKILTRQLSDNKKSGKEATQDGKKSDQLLNKSDNKKEKIDQSVSSVNKKIVNKTLKTLDNVKIEHKKDEGVSIDGKMHSATKTMSEQSVEIKQKKSTQHDDTVDQPEQLIALLQSSGQTLTTSKKISAQTSSIDPQAKPKAKIDLSAPLHDNDVLSASKKSVDKRKVDTVNNVDNKIELVKKELHAKDIKVKNSVGKNSVGKNSLEKNITDKKLSKDIKPVDAVILADVTKAKGEQTTLLSKDTKGEQTTLLSKDTKGEQTEISNAFNLSEKKQVNSVQNGNSVSKLENTNVRTEIPATNNLVDAKIDVSQLTKQQLQKLALLKNARNKNHDKGQTPPIIVKSSSLTSLQDDTKLTTKKSNKFKLEKLPLSKKETSVKDKNHTDLLKSASKGEKRSVPKNTQFSVIGTTDSLTTNISDVSDTKLKDVQSLQVVLQKIVENNVQTQKVDLSNQIQSININRKDFVATLQDKVMVMVQQKINQVDIRLDPPELGHMHVRLNLHNEQANIQFIVQHQQAKEVLDQNMPRLKEMLAQQGVNVGDANVGHQNEQSSTGMTQSNAIYQKGDISEDDYFEENNQVFSVNSFKASALGVDYYA